MADDVVGVAVEEDLLGVVEEDMGVLLLCQNESEEVFVQVEGKCCGGLCCLCYAQDPSR